MKLTIRHCANPTREHPHLYTYATGYEQTRMFHRDGSRSEGVVLLDHEGDVRGVLPIPDGKEVGNAFIDALDKLFRNPDIPTDAEREFCLEITAVPNEIIIYVPNYTDFA